MIRYLFGFLPLAIFAIGLLSSSLDSEGSLPHYTSELMMFGWLIVVALFNVAGRRMLL